MKHKLDKHIRDYQIDQSTQDPEDPEFSLLLKEKKIAIKTIEKLNYKLTPADLAANSELSMNQASFWLNKVAGETRGSLQVTGDGSVIYNFERNFKDAYLKRGVRKTLLLFGAFLFNLLYWVVRVSFGVALVLSVLLVVVLIVAVIIAAVSGSDSGGDCSCDCGGFFDPGFVGDLFSWNYSPSSTYYPNSLPSTRRQKYEKFNRTHKRGNFFLECFSCLFGDGAPNSNLQEIRWKHIARVIKQNGGVVSTEQLAPFLDGDSSNSGMILSALAQFNGRPEVTPSGFIVYVFPDFLDPENAPVLPAMINEAYLKENHWKFSASPPSTWAVVLSLALLNFAGSWWLFKHIATISLLHQVAALIDVLLGYAIIFLAIPLMRAIVLVVLNQRIDARNEKRRKAFELVDRPEGEILKEISEASQIRLQEVSKLSTNRTVIYTTEKDQIEQNLDFLE